MVNVISNSNCAMQNNVCSKLSKIDCYIEIAEDSLKAQHSEAVLIEAFRSIDDLFGDDVQFDPETGRLIDGEFFHDIRAKIAASLGLDLDQIKDWTLIISEEGDIVGLGVEVEHKGEKGWVTVSLNGDDNLKQLYGFIGGVTESEFQQMQEAGDRVDMGAVFNDARFFKKHQNRLFDRVKPMVDKLKIQWKPPALDTAVPSFTSKFDFDFSAIGKRFPIDVPKVKLLSGLPTMVEKLTPTVPEVSSMIRSLPEIRKPIGFASGFLKTFERTLDLPVTVPKTLTCSFGGGHPFMLGDVSLIEHKPVPFKFDNLINLVLEPEEPPVIPSFSLSKTNLLDLSTDVLFNGFEPETVDLYSGFGSKLFNTGFTTTTADAVVFEDMSVFDFEGEYSFHEALFGVDTFDKINKFIEGYVGSGEMAQRFSMELSMLWRMSRGHNIKLTQTAKLFGHGQEERPGAVLKDRNENNKVDVADFVEFIELLMADGAFDQRSELVDLLGEALVAELGYEFGPDVSVFKFSGPRPASFDVVDLDLGLDLFDLAD